MIRVAGILSLALGVTTGCQTWVGNYFANRVRDFGECFLVQGVVFRANEEESEFQLAGIGGGVRLAGLVDFGFGIGPLAGSNTAGWSYGRGIWGRARATETWHGPLYITRDPMPGVDDGAQRRARGARSQVGVLPAVFVEYLVCAETGKSDVPTARWASPWGAAPDDAEARWARVHAFDIEVAWYHGFFGVRLGISPGELLDFLLGWFVLDLAGDDREIGDPKALPEEGPRRKLVAPRR